MSMPQQKVTVPKFIARKQTGEKITILTAYDATIARLLDRAGVDALLVGDSLGTVIMGCETTLPVTLDAVLHHTRAVARGAERALVIADMPFLTYQVDAAEALRNAGRLLQDGGAAAVKLEGGCTVAETVRRIVAAGIPVMGHIGLVPQAVHQLGGFRAVGRTQAEADELLEDARCLEQAGVFSIVLESIPAVVAETITRQVKIPTIGIGAGAGCDGQVLVSYDAFGLFDSFVPKFVKQYAKLGEAITKAAQEYISDVRSGQFPANEHSISPAE